MNEATLHAARYKGASVTERDFEYAIERVIAGRLYIGIGMEIVPCDYHVTVM